MWVLTCNGKVYHVSILVVNGPVGVPHRVGKLNQVPELGRGHDAVELQR